ncbi:MAG: Phenylpyruvate C(3)-methyltransferase [bacterium]|nr:Phenylpyruvate C(3)-methyltransferase [bacterium]
MQIKEADRQDFLTKQTWKPDLQNEVLPTNGFGAHTADIFNSAIAASAIAALFDLGLFDELQQSEAIRLQEFCEKRELHQPAILMLLYTLACFDIVTLSPAQDLVRPGKAFAETCRDKGYFLWLVRGYGYLWQNLSDLVKSGKGNFDSVGRDGGYIAKAGRDYGAQFVDAYFTEMLYQMPFKVAADLGCGSAMRLINLAKQNPAFHGIGIDINDGAVKLAQGAITAANLQDRLTVVHADAGRLQAQPEFAEVEVLFCFFMAHDLWPRANCLKVLQQIRSVFPRLKRFLLSDTYRADLPASRHVPIFTLGFEVTHAVMGQYIPSVAEWMELFTEAGWNCVERREIGIPFSAIFDLR